MTDGVLIGAALMVSTLAVAGVTKYYRKKYTKSDMSRLYPILCLNYNTEHLQSIKIIHNQMKQTFKVVRNSGEILYLASEALHNVWFLRDQNQKILWTIKQDGSQLFFVKKSFAVSNTGDQSARVLKFKCCKDNTSRFTIVGQNSESPIEYTWLAKPRYLEKVDARLKNRGSKLPVHKRIALSINMTETRSKVTTHQIIYNKQEIDTEALATSVILSILNLWRERAGDSLVIEKARLWNRNRNQEVLDMVEPPQEDAYFITSIANAEYFDSGDCRQAVLGGLPRAQRWRRVLKNMTAQVIGEPKATTRPEPKTTTRPNTEAQGRNGQARE